MEVIDETLAQLGSTLETKSLTFAHLEPLFLHGTRLLLMLDTWSMKPYTCMNFHTSSHLKILIQSKPSCSKNCLSQSICTNKWILCFWTQTSMNAHPCHVWTEVCVKTCWITTPAPVWQTSLEATVRQVCFYSLEFNPPSHFINASRNTLSSLCFCFPLLWEKCLTIEDVYTASHLLSLLYLACCDIFQLGLTQRNWKSEMNEERECSRITMASDHMSD